MMDLDAVLGSVKNHGNLAEIPVAIDEVPPAALSQVL